MFSLYSPVKVYGMLILLAMLGLNFFYIHHLRAVNRDLVAWKTNYLIEQQLLTDTQRLQNAEKKLEADAELKQVDSERKLALERLNLTMTNTLTLQKELNNAKATIAHALDDAYQLRVQSAVNDSTTASKIPISTKLSAEVGDDCNATLVATVRACQDTTINYNALRDSWDKNCAIYGCDNL